MLKSNHISISLPFLTLLIQPIFNFNPSYFIEALTIPCCAYTKFCSRAVRRKRRMLARDEKLWYILRHEGRENWSRKLTLIPSPFPLLTLRSQLSCITAFISPCPSSCSYSSPCHQPLTKHASDRGRMMLTEG